jgi:hypothetical protein
MTDTIAVALISGGFSILGIVLNARISALKNGQNKLHSMVNDRMTEMLLITHKLGVREGEENCGNGTGNHNENLLLDNTSGNKSGTA